METAQQRVRLTGLSRRSAAAVAAIFFCAECTSPGSFLYHRTHFPMTQKNPARLSPGQTSRSKRGEVFLFSLVLISFFPFCGILYINIRKILHPVFPLPAAKTTLPHAVHSAGNRGIPSQSLLIPCRMPLPSAAAETSAHPWKPAQRRRKFPSALF